MKVIVLMLGAGICFAQSSTRIQTNGPSAASPLTANAGTGQPFPATVVTGRSFTAEAIIESNQILPDGSHVVNRQTVAAARDSQGRTYREEILGSPASDSSAVKTIVISDPVAQAQYLLGPDHIARKTRMAAPPSNQGSMSVSTGMPALGDLALQRFHTGSGGSSGPVHADPQTALAPEQWTAVSDSKTEPLGTRMIAGMLAEGTRVTMTIPAGQVGNQNAPTIVTERWYSKDLEATVLVRRTDPRFGTSTYQFTQVQQIEPPASLFQIPSGYTVEEEMQ